MSTENSNNVCGGEFVQHYGGCSILKVSEAHIFSSLGPVEIIAQVSLSFTINSATKLSHGLKCTCLRMG